MGKEILIKCVCGNEAVYDVDATGVKCKYCKRPIIPKDYAEAKTVPPVEREQCIRILKTLSDQNSDQPQLKMALGLFYLAKGGYQMAEMMFAKVIEEDPMNADAFYYKAISSFGGKKPFVQMTSVIENAIENLEIAKGIEGKPIYYYTHAVIAFDFYKRKFIKHSPTFDMLLDEADMYGGVDPNEANELFNMLNMPKPQNF